VRRGGHRERESDVDEGGANIRCEPPFAMGRGTVWRECGEYKKNKKKRGDWDEREY